MRKISVYVNGKYAFTTKRFNTIKECIKNARERKIIEVASIPNYIIEIKENDIVKGYISK